MGIYFGQYDSRSGLNFNCARDMLFNLSLWSLAVLSAMPCFGMAMPPSPGKPSDHFPAPVMPHPHPPPPPPPPNNGPKPWSTFSENIIFQPDSSHSVIYPRQVELSDGSLLATVSYSGDAKPFFPIFQSKDGGATWKWISNLTDQVNGLGLAAQPALTELPFDIGGYKTGTVLASGNSWGNTSTNIDLYASADKGFTWKFVSNVARGSAPSTEDGNPCIWEPFIQYV
jgi:hypothetical protein